MSPTDWDRRDTEPGIRWENLDAVDDTWTDFGTNRTWAALGATVWTNRIEP